MPQAKQLKDLLGYSTYKQLEKEVQKIYPKQRITNGNTILKEDVMQKILQVHNISIAVDEDGDINAINKSVNPDIKVIPLEPILNKPETSYIDIINKEYDDFTATEIKPETIKKRLMKLSPNIQDAFKTVEKCKKCYKAKINETLFRDADYIRCLLNGYTYLILPLNLSKNLRSKILPFGIKSYMTDTFNNKIIAYNDDGEVIHVYIV